MAGPQVLEQRAGAQEYEASEQADEEDMADQRGSGENHTDEGVGICQGIDPSGRMHVLDHGSRHIGGARVRGEETGRHGTVQGLLRCLRKPGNSAGGEEDQRRSRLYKYTFALGWLWRWTCTVRIACGGTQPLHLYSMYDRVRLLNQLVNEQGLLTLHECFRHPCVK